MALTGELKVPMAGAADAVRAPLGDLARGDERALRAAYRDHHQAIRAFARRLIGDDPEAEDLVHEVFVRLPAAVRRFRGDASLRTLLVAMAVNHARHHVRSAARRRAATERLARHARSAIVEERNPAERRELAQALTRALDTLPLDQRVAFVLCEVEERSSAEAAAIAGTSDGTLRARLLLARKKLRVLLAAWGHGTTADPGDEAASRAMARAR